MLIELRGDFKPLVFGEVFWISLYLPQHVRRRVCNRTPHAFCAPPGEPFWYMLIELRGDFENLVFGEVFWISLYLPQHVRPWVCNGTPHAFCAPPGEPLLVYAHRASGGF